MVKKLPSDKALLISDLHASFSSLKKLEGLLAKEAFSLILFAGDVVNMGEPVGFAEQFIKLIQDSRVPFLWVPGNNDFGRSYYKVKAKFPSLESKVIESCGRKFTGVGGSPASWAGQYAGESMVDRKMIGGTIFISHFPPPGVRTYVKYDDGQVTSDIGGKHLSDSPLVHICGHLHHRWGISYLGTTKVVQLAALELGYYAIMDLETLKVEFKRL